jgi:signal transduction histidine kinase
MPCSPLRWAALAIAAPVLCFLVSSAYLSRWSAQLDEAAQSIAGNGGPSVVDLSAAWGDIRKIDARAMFVQPSSLEADRAIIAELKADFDRSLAAYRETPDYPGELAAWELVHGRCAPFFDAVDGLLATVCESGAARAEAGARLRSAVDALVASMEDLVEINARAITADAATAEALRRRIVWLSTARDALALAFVVAGTALGLHGARQAAARAAERHRQDEERLAEMDVFSGRVAHDLRDPLAAIMMRCGMASRMETLESARDALARVDHQARRMSETIEALLTFARAGASPTPGRRSDVAAVLREVVVEVELQAAAAGTAVVVEPVRDVAVACEPGVLAVVLTNLVRNAIKYIGDGSAGVRRVALRARPDGAWLRFEVEDTGPGIPPGAAARVFEPFVRLKGTSTPGKPGIGLGLATVKRLVEAHGGTVGVDSKPGRGCCFWFTLVRAP